MEFKVQKCSERSETPTRRLLCLSETCLVERDLQTYAVVCARQLKTVSVLREQPPLRLCASFESTPNRSGS